MELQEVKTAKPHIVIRKAPVEFILVGPLYPVEGYKDQRDAVLVRSEDAPLELVAEAARDTLGSSEEPRAPSFLRWLLVGRPRFSKSA